MTSFHAQPARRATPSRLYPGEPPKGRIVVRRGTLVGLSAFLALFLVWAAATTWYIASKDELAQHYFARETEMQYGYEDRLTQLKARLERETTQHLVERTSVDARVEALAARQAEIEARQAVLRKLAVRTNGVKAPTVADEPRKTPPGFTVETGTTPRKPAPLPDELTLRLRDTPTTSSIDRRDATHERLSFVAHSLERVAAEETHTLDDLRQAARTRLARLRSTLDEIGLDRGPLAAQGGVGGPLVELPKETTGGTFGIAGAELGANLAEFDRLKAIARALPLSKPIVGELEQTSPFGYRIDPFTRAAALHTGIDLRAEYGAPVEATGAGRVTIAEPTGGYGNMVEIDHGGGIVTRYGHLSAFAVAAGDRVEVGQTIGRAGSTGRSTGTHVHYEVRINGEPVNPSRFLTAATQLAALHD